MPTARTIAVLLRAALLVVVTASMGLGGTIAPGQSRVVEGKVAAVDVAHRSVLVEVPRPEGALTVGVTLDAGVEPQARGKPLPLSQIAIGDGAVLRYTRQDGRLIGLGLEIRQ